MTTIQHRDIEDAQLHEPKGAASASAGEVLTANGAGGSSWTAINNANKIVLNLHHDDISTNTSHFVVSPMAGTVETIWSVIDTAIAGGDTVLTASIGGTPITGGAITITESGSAAGDVDSCTPSAANTVAAGQAIEVESDGVTTTSGACAHLTIVIDVS